MIPATPSRHVPRDITMEPYTESELREQSGIPNVAGVYCTPVNNKRIAGAPHRIVHLQNLQDTVDMHLQPCTKCKSKGQRLCQTNATGFAITLEIVCDNCVSVANNLRHQMRYIESKMKNMKIESSNDQKEQNKLKRQIKNKRSQLTDDSHIKRISPTKNSKFVNNKKVRVGRKDAMQYDLNIRAMLAAYYGGTGGFNVGLFANFFGFTGGRSWERTWHRQSEKVHTLMLDLINLIITEALSKEIEATIKCKLEGKYTNDETEQAINHYLDGNYSQLPDELLTIGIAVSFDMGWQKRSTGRVYDSMSGHGFIIGCRTKNVVGFGLKKKKCSNCTSFNKHNLPIVAHKCSINWSGSSGAMEASLAQDLIRGIFENSGGRVFVEYVVSDDDSTMRAYCKAAENGGKLPQGIPEPTFYADPSHRIKCMAKPIYKMVTSPPVKDPGRCKNIDACRVKKYTSCCIAKNRMLPIDEFCSKAKAPIEHLFNCHTWCDAEWCWAKQLDDAAHTMMTNAMKDKVRI